MIRVGFGYDVHRFATGRRLMLGGVEVPHERGLSGHSDADILLHAITDALLGAAALGDIGSWFPDTDPRWKDADSLDLLRAAAGVVGDAGWTVGNVDSTVVMEAPRLRPYVDAMRERIAGALGLGVGQVSVKATTSEGMGFVGTRDGAAAYAVCTLVPVDRVGGDDRSAQ